MKDFKFGTFGDMLTYIRNNVIAQPGEGEEGADLRLDIYNDEITFTVDDLYEGPAITYNVDGEMYVTFRGVEGFTDDTADISEDNILLAAAFMKILRNNSEMINNFLNRG